MALRTLLTFEADFVDDSEFTSGGEIERPGGRNVAEALAELLRRQGANASDPIQHSFYGWAFTVGEAGELGFVLQYPGPWLLLSEEQSSKINEHKHHEILDALNRDLSVDKRFSAVTWYTKEDYEKGKAGEQSP